MFPIFFWGELRPPRRQKQGNRLQIDHFVFCLMQVVVQGVSLRIEANTFFIEVALEQDRYIIRKAESLDPPPETALAKGFCFVECSEDRPIAEHESCHLGNSSTRLEEKPCDHFIALSGKAKRQVFATL